jgi:hypothetical protein
MIQFIFLLILLPACSLARQIFTPLQYGNIGDPVRLMKYCREKNEDRDGFAISPKISAYYRWANEAFGTSNKTADISTIYHGSDLFDLSDLFYDSKIPAIRGANDAVENQFLPKYQNLYVDGMITPDYRVSNMGVMLGVDLEKEFDNWEMSIHARIPVSRMHVQQKKGYDAIEITTNNTRDPEERVLLDDSNEYFSARLDYLLEHELISQKEMKNPQQYFAICTDCDKDGDPVGRTKDASLKPTLDNILKGSISVSETKESKVIMQTWKDLDGAVLAHTDTGKRFKDVLKEKIIVPLLFFTADNLSNYNRDKRIYDALATMVYMPANEELGISNDINITTKPISLSNNDVFMPIPTKWMYTMRGGNEFPIAGVDYLPGYINLPPRDISSIDKNQTAADKKFKFIEGDNERFIGNSCVIVSARSTAYTNPIDYTQCGFETAPVVLVPSKSFDATNISKYGTIDRSENLSSIANSENEPALIDRQLTGLYKGSMNALYELDKTTSKNQNYGTLWFEVSYDLTAIDRSTFKNWHVQTSLNGDGIPTEASRLMYNALSKIENANYEEKHTINVVSGQLKNGKKTTWEDFELIGQGDLNLEVAFKKSFDENFNGSMLIGLVVPTGKITEHEATRSYLATPIGNNGHYEMRLGAQISYDFSNSISGILYGSLSHALSTQEKIIAAFKGTGAFGLQPTWIYADTSWWQMLLSGDIVAEIYNGFGLNFGYQYMFKTEDTINPLQKTAKDATGETEELSFKKVKEYSQRQSHKIKVTGFSQCFENTQFEVGFSAIVGGEDIMKERDIFARVSHAF